MTPEQIEAAAPTQDEIESAASAIVHTRGMRRGVPSYGNVLAILPPDLKAEVMEEAEAALKAAAVARARSREIRRLPRALPEAG